MEKAIYPRSGGGDPSEYTISKLLPQTGYEGMSMDLLKKSEVVDGTKIQGTGSVLGHYYRWRLILESGVRSVAQVPDRFFDVEGRSYPIDWNSKVSVFNGEAAAFSNFKDAVIYRVGAAQQDLKAKPYIIFDAWMDIAEHKQNVGKDEIAESLQKYLTSYKENLSAHTVTSVTGDDSSNAAHNFPPSDLSSQKLPLTEATFLAIVVDNENNYHVYVTNANEDLVNSTKDSQITWYEPQKKVVTSQFKGLDMWIRFESINEMIYFILTKYERDILSIKAAYRAEPEEKTQTYTRKVYTLVEEDEGEPAKKKYSRGRLNSVSVVSEKGTPEDGTNIETIQGVRSWVEYTTNSLGRDDTSPDALVGKDTTVIEDYDNAEVNEKTEGKLWAYVNPRTMKPFSDDYWLHAGEPYYIKSLTMAPAGKQIKGNKIVIKGDQWPGMFMFVGETYIKNRDTGENQRMQIKFPQVYMSSEQTLTLEADGDPTVFNMNMEVAQPRSGSMMEITAYEIATKMVQGENGCYYAVDGSSEVLSE